mmetsp:Transcript_89736/g.159504  ORF Transcript_89736/g.159504 Transcript_89736/m.159504 type:complete len:278 (-) Transcript_89736:66-899(-)
MQSLPLCAPEGLGLFDALNLQELWKLQLVSKSLRGSIRKSPLQWSTVTSQAMLGISISPSLFVSSSEEVIDALPSLAEAARKSSLPGTRITSLSEMRRLMQRLSTLSKVSEEHLAQGNEWAEVSLAEFTLAPPSVTAAPINAYTGPDKQQLPLHMNIAHLGGRLLLQLSTTADEKAPPTTLESLRKEIAKSRFSYGQEVIVDLLSSGTTKQLVHCRNVLTRIDGPWVEASGICTLLPGDASKMLFAICLRDFNTPRVLLRDRGFEALQIDSVGWHSS